MKVQNINKALKAKFELLKKNDKLNTSYPIRKQDWDKYSSNEAITFNDKYISIYIHIPFCKTLCKFCEYIKFARKDNNQEREYVEAIIKDIKDFYDKYPDKILCGLDIGGGTPTVLDEENFEYLLSSVKKIIDKYQKIDNFLPSIEATFDTMSQKKARDLVKYGFKRISFGLQTFDKKVLKKYNRNNGNIENILNIIKMCRQEGVEIVNIDLMYGLEYIRKSSIKATMKVIKEINPEHLTFYEFRTNILKVKENYTKKQLYKQYKALFKEAQKCGYKGRFGQNTFTKLCDKGLSSYLENRMINFVNYFGVGIAAQSKGDNGLSYNFGKNYEKYSDCFQDGRIKKGDTYLLPEQELLSKFIAVSGYYGAINMDVCSKILKQDFAQKYQNEIEFLKRKKLVNIENKNLILTQNGFEYYGAILGMFYKEEYVM